MIMEGGLDQRKKEEEKKPYKLSQVPEDQGSGQERPKSQRKVRPNPLYSSLLTISTLTLFSIHNDPPTLIIPTYGVYYLHSHSGP